MKAEEFRYIVRIVCTDVDEKKKLPYDFLEINDINRRPSDDILKVTGFNPEMRAGEGLELGGTVAVDL